MVLHFVKWWLFQSAGRESPCQVLRRDFHP
jgi:hypothetical protein